MPISPRLTSELRKNTSMDAPPVRMHHKSANTPSSSTTVSGVLYSHHRTEKGTDVKTVHTTGGMRRTQAGSKGRASEVGTVSLFAVSDSRRANTQA